MEKIPVVPNKKSRMQKILSAVNSNIETGMSAEQAIEKLSIEQYDFLIDNNINLDEMLLTSEQIETANKIVRSPRPVGLSYTKRNHTPALKEVYETITKAVKNLGVEEIQQSSNLRDLSFTKGGVKYKVVLSRPRK